MKPYVKYVVTTVVCVVIFVIVLMSKNSEKNYLNNNNHTTVQVTTVEETTDKKEETTVIDVETVYHQNIGVDNLIADYNKIAEIEITPDMVSDGTYGIDTNILVDNVSVIIINSNDSLSVDYSYEGKSDEAIYPLFRDFSKALNPSLTNKKIKNAWSEIKKGNYTNTSFYNLKGIEITYITGEVDEKNNHYIISTKLNRSE